MQNVMNFKLIDIPDGQAWVYITVKNLVDSWWDLPTKHQSYYVNLLDPGVTETGWILPTLRLV